jgi:hypothetical protein
MIFQKSLISEEAQMNKFNVGDRCCFPWKYGMVEFGKVVKSDHGGERLLIRADNGNMYQTCGSAVINLSKKKND